MFTIAYPEIIRASKFAEKASKVFDFWPGLPGVGSFSPAVDLKEDQEGLEVRVSMPGVDAKDIKIVAEAGWLRIEGKVEEDQGADDPPGASYLLRESLSGAFAREIKLPDWADSEKTAASLALGILKLRIPRKEESKPRTININVE